MQIITVIPQNELKDFNVANPCVKQTVKALIVSVTGAKVLGSNAINNKVNECPRVVKGCVTGEGYDLCKSVCNQNEHAEVTAIQNAKKANIDLKGSTLYLTGHTYFCDNCTQAMKEAGIKKAVCFDSDTIISF